MNNHMELMRPVLVVKVKCGIMFDGEHFISNEDLKLLKKGVIPHE